MSIPNLDGNSQVNLLSVKDLSGIFRDVLLMWNNNKPNDLNYYSVTLQNILSSNNLISFNNSNSEFNIKNTGLITLNNGLEVEKNSTEGGNVNIRSNLVLSENQNVSQGSTLNGVEGQININGNNLFVYLGGVWRRINTV